MSLKLVLKKIFPDKSDKSISELVSKLNDENVSTECDLKNLVNDGRLEGLNLSEGMKMKLKNFYNVCQPSDESSDTNSNDDKDDAFDSDDMKQRKEREEIDKQLEDERKKLKAQEKEYEEEKSKNRDAYKKQTDQSRLRNDGNHGYTSNHPTSYTYRYKNNDHSQSETEYEKIQLAISQNRKRIAQKVEMYEIKKERSGMMSGLGEFKVDDKDDEDEDERLKRQLVSQIDEEIRKLIKQIVSNDPNFTFPDEYISIHNLRTHEEFKRIGKGKAGGRMHKILKELKKLNYIRYKVTDDSNRFQLEQDLRMEKQRHEEQSHKSSWFSIHKFL